MIDAVAVFGVGEYLSAPVRHAVGAPPPELYASDVLIPTPRGPVTGWVARGAGDGVVILLHGVRASRQQMSARALWLNRLGYSVLLIDLPSHGHSAGKRITFGAHEADAVRSAIAWVRRSMAGHKVGVIGVSLGAAALVLSRPGATVDAVVLEAMYPTIEEAIENRLRMYLGAPGAWLAPLLSWQLPLRLGVALERLRPIDAMSALASPVLVIGGEEDRHTSAAETRRIFAAARADKALWLVPGAAHSDLYAYSKANYEMRIGGFLQAKLRR
ncbi:MAG: alpha/beta hydrolase [Pseudomonadota bacterium]